MTKPMSHPKTSAFLDSLKSLKHEEMQHYDLECEHTDVCEDEFVCLDCGKCLREDYMSRAYDRAKDLHYDC